ncbi:MAG: dipeptidase [Actinomycetota bacterium]|nr:dipeptidase [Actinomycetota bacterium]
MATPRLAGYLDDERDRIYDVLVDWLRIPSISALPEHHGDVRRSADRVVELLLEAGFEHVRVLETGDADGPGLPAVYADWLHAGPDAPTALVYGHHDVQPADPLELWTSPPFDPEIVDGELRARGAVDDKGQTLYEIEAARGLLRTEGSLPVNLKFLIEGEEEIGSPHFEALLGAHRALLACDVVVVSDTTMWAVDVPSFCVGMRGLVAFDLDVRTAAADLHSGSFGGAVPNAAHLIAELVTKLHSVDGRVTIPRFYDDVRPLTEGERTSIERLPFTEAEFKATAGVQRLQGEVGRTTLERIWTRPTCEVTGITTGYGGAGMKTIVPATANAKVSFRLVADQDPAAIAAAFEQWLADEVPAGVDWTITPLGAVAPALTPPDHPAVGALAQAMTTVWGVEPLLTREGGSGPEEALGRVLESPVLYLGIALAGDRFHAPNERILLDQFDKGLLCAGELWHELATALASPPDTTRRETT